VKYEKKSDGGEKLSNVLIIIIGVMLPIAFIVFVLLMLK